MPAEKPRRTARARQLHVAGWVVDPEASAASRDNETIHVRPQLVDLLFYLAERAGRTVSKDELLDAVWPDKFIAEAGIARCVAELRQLLKDDSREPQIIQTVPKRGYRLIAPVTFVDLEPPASLQAPEPPREVLAPEASTAPAEPAPLDSAATAGAPDADAVSPSADGPPVPAIAAPRAAPAPRRRLAYVAAAAVCLVLVVGSIYWRTGSDSPLLAERDSLVLAFENTTAEQVFDRTLLTALSMEIEQSPYLRVVPDATTSELLRLMGRQPDEPMTPGVARDLCQRAGAKAILSGSLSSVGRRYVVTLTAEACATGRPLFRTQAQADTREEVLQAVERVASSARRGLGEVVRTLRPGEAPLARATTASLEALRAFSLGEARRLAGDHLEALRLYLKAAEVDPDFASAHARAGYQYWLLADRPHAHQAFRKAYELSEKASEPERLYIKALYCQQVLQDPTKTVDVATVWRRLYPGSHLPAMILAVVYSDMLGRHDLAIEEAREVARLVPGSAEASLLLGRTLLYGGRTDEARAVLNETLRLRPDMLNARWFSYQLAVLQDDEETAERELKWANGDAVARFEFLHLQGLRAMAAGRPNAAKQLIDQAWDWGVAHGRPDEVATMRSRYAVGVALFGEAASARREAEKALALSQSPVSTAMLGVALALAGDVPGAQAVDRRLEKDALPGMTMVNDVLRPMVAAAIRLAQGQPQEALAQLDRLVPFDTAQNLALLPITLRARALLAAGRFAEAAEAGRQLASHRSVVPLSPVHTVALLDLARALARLGDEKASREAYAQVLAGWSKAEPDVPLIAAAKRERDTASDFPSTLGR